MTYIGELDQKFIAVDQVLFVIIMAANYLDIGPLLCIVSPSTCITFSFPILSRSDVGCKTVTDPGKIPEETRKPPPTLLITSLPRWLTRRVDSTLLLIQFIFSGPL